MNERLANHDFHILPPHQATYYHIIKQLKKQPANEDNVGVHARVT
jgi:hypothetical protein